MRLLHFFPLPLAARRLANHSLDARVVFETTVSKLAQKPETLSRAKPLYAFIHDFESRYGELVQIIKLEKRMSDLFPEDPRLSLFSQRFTNNGFDPTAVHPIISPSTQARQTTLSGTQHYIAANSTPEKIIQVSSSPKRALPLDDSDTDGGRPQKLARVASPLKGAAGRRLDQQKRHQPTQDLTRYEHQPPSQAPPLPVLPRDVMFLLSIIPKAETYTVTKFKVDEMIKLIRETNLPSSAPPLRPQPSQMGLHQMTSMSQPPPMPIQPPQPRPMSNMPPIPQGPYMQHMQPMAQQHQISQLQPMGPTHPMQQIHPMAQAQHMSMQPYPQTPHGQYPGGYYSTSTFPRSHAAFAPPPMNFPGFPAFLQAQPKY